MLHGDMCASGFHNTPSFAELTCCHSSCCAPLLLLLLLQPRRVAAMSVAKRVSEEMGVELGAEVCLWVGVGGS
jgi:hypothetical protein